MTDFRFANHGSIAILTPLTEVADEWVAEHLPDDAMRWAGGVAIEPRYVEPILEGLQGDGLAISIRSSCSPKNTSKRPGR